MYRIFMVLALSVPACLGQQQVLTVDGDDDYVDVPHHAALAVSGDMTIEAWIRIDSYPTTPAEIANKKRRNPYEGFWFHLQTGQLLFGGYHTTTSGNGYHQAAASWTAIVPGQWAHVAGVISGSTVQVLINGVVLGSGSFPGGMSGSPTNPFRIGHDSEYPMWNGHAEFEGRIDEVRYWSVARTPAEIQATMHQEVDGLPGLVAAWHLNGNALDLTGNHNGTLVGDAGFTSPSPITCTGGITCLGGNLPFPIGGIATMELISPAANAPLFVFIDTATGTIPLGSYGTSQLALSPQLFAIADFTGNFGPGIAAPLTGPFGEWSFSLPLPNDPSLVSLVFYSEAYVLDFFAPNGLFRQSNLLTITFQ